MRALIHARWSAASSYRLRMLLSILALSLTIVPVYFVARALQPVMANSIMGEGGQYFGFLIIGLVTFQLIPVAVNSLPDEIGSGIKTGVLEALLGTPTRLPTLLTGMIGFNMLWTTLRTVIFLIAASVLGANLLWSQFALGLVILALVVLAYLPVGILASALVIAFRTPSPIPQGVLLLSALLGGVYYPTKVIPSWIQSVSDFIPLTYGLRALRGTMLQGESLQAVLPDLAILSGFIILMLAGSWGALMWSLRYARRNGTLAQY